MDYRFIRLSTTDFSKPNSKQDRVVESYDGFLSYLLVIDEASRYAWVFLCEFKEPPTEYASQFLTAFGLKSGGVIQCDQGGELAQSEEFCTEMLKRHGYVVEPTSADSPSQNGGAERMNGTLGVMVRTLLYGAELDAEFWSAALLHAIYLYNRRVHSAIGRTPFESWFGSKPNFNHQSPNADRKQSIKCNDGARQALAFPRIIIAIPKGIQ